MQMMQVIDTVRTLIRRAIRPVAQGLHTISAGHITPNGVTIISVAAHIPIAILIGMGDNLPAALLLIVFGLFDTLDGELARLQGSASAAGMLLDASADRIKEVVLYAGIVFVLTNGQHPQLAVWALVACGASLCVSYVKAKGEAAVATSGKKLPHADINRIFKDGLLTFELRMTALIIGLVFGQLLWAVALIAVLASYTVLQRLVKISKALS